jgi:dipeptidyl-peptidase 4
VVNTGNRRFDQIYGDFAALTTGGDIVPAWSPDGGSLAYVVGPADDLRGWLVDTATGEKSELVDVTAVRDGVRAVTGVTPAGRGLPFDEVEFAAPGRITARVGDHRVTVELDTGAVTGTPLTDPDAHTRRVYDLPRPGPARTYRRSVPGLDPQLAVETPSPDGRYWISTRDADIVRRSAYDGREVRWTSDGTPEHEWQFDPHDPMLARSGWVAQEVNWSPDGSRLAAYRVDVLGVARAPKIH